MLILNLFINAIYWEHRGTNKLRLKMKTFRLIGMALLAVVMCVNFASCSSDEDLPNAKGAILVLGGNTPIEYSDFWINETEGIIRVNDGGQYGGTFNFLPFTEEIYFYLVSEHLGKTITNENFNKEVLFNNKVPETCKTAWRLLNDYEYIAYIGGDSIRKGAKITIFIYNKR